MKRALPALLALCLGGMAPKAEPGELFFRSGDRVAVIGDSITVSGTYQKYLDNFIRTRFPRWTFGMRCAGVNGCTAQIGFPLIEADVLAWKPTVAVINYGMNDGRRKDGVAYYKAGIVPYVDRLLANNVRVVLCSNTPVDIGDEPGKPTSHNKDFDLMAQ